MRILLAEDNQRFGQLLVEHLSDAGYTVDLTMTASGFRHLATIYVYALYLVDLGLPDGDGLGLIEELRQAKCAAPILILTARSTVQDRVSGLDCGADDYLVKPFNHAELLARVRALSRRPANLVANSMRVGHLTLDFITGEVCCDGRRIDLRPSEQRLLALLIKRSGRLVPRTTIEDSLQSLGNEKTANALDKLISRLRRSLRDEQAGIELKTVKGLGYVLEEVQ